MINIDIPMLRVKNGPFCEKGKRTPEKGGVKGIIYSYVHWVHTWPPSQPTPAQCTAKPFSVRIWPTLILSNMLRNIHFMQS